MAGTVCLEMLQSRASENPGLSHLSIPLFLVHQVSVLSPLRPKPLPAPELFALEADIICEPSILGQGREGQWSAVAWRSPAI